MWGPAWLTWFIFAFWTLQVEGNKDSGYRLPESVVPQHYDLQIITHLENNSFTFNGQVSIKVRCLQATKNITLHSKLLLIQEKDVKLDDLQKKTNIKIDHFEYDGANDFFIIHTAEELTEHHDYLIYIPFSGVLRNNLNGYYRSSYTLEETKEKKWLAVTQFEATDARMAFPCFDEPAMKAIFKINLGRTQNYTSLSNMPILGTVPIEGMPGWFWDQYEETLPMSTYLVAFAVTDFEFVPSTTKHGTTLFRVWARHEAIHQVDLATLLGPKVLEYYEDFFNISYPLPKQDMIAIPDFSAGAMENWGLITYRESALLHDAVSASVSHKTSTAEVIAHELAHQWFGNLVTMKWWTDLWLNEGFATYMASLSVHHLFPEWNFFTQETVGNLLSVFSKDSLKTSHPVSVPVGNPKEIDEIFDTISYDKGSFLLHMMASFLGAETFRIGVSNYLTQHKYNNAEQDDLWAALTNQAHKDNVLPSNLTVKTIMDTWTLQTGYPVVTVTRDYLTKTAHLRQERFLRDTIKNLRSSETCWWVPLTYTTEKQPNFEIKRPETWLSCPSANSNSIMNLPDADEWVLFNIQAAGLYRVNYDEKNWHLLISFLNSDQHSKIHSINKVQLIDDSANLAWVGDLNYTIHFDLLQYLKNERDYLPWRSALASIETLNRMLKRTSVYGIFKLYMKELLGPVYNHTGGFTVPENPEDHLEEVKHKVQITSWGCKYEVGDCVKDAQEFFSKWYSNPEKNIIPKDLRPIVYCNAIRHGGEKEWNFIWKQYQKSNIATEKNIFLHSLGCTKEIWLLHRYLEWAIDANSGIRLQDCISVLQAVGGNDLGYYILTSFLQIRIEDIYKHLSTSNKKIARVIATIASQMTNEHEYNELKQFTVTNEKYLLGGKQGIRQSLETVELHIQWQRKHYKEINNLLTKYL